MDGPSVSPDGMFINRNEALRKMARHVLLFIHILCSNTARPARQEVMPGYINKVFRFIYQMDRPKVSHKGRFIFRSQVQCNLGQHTRLVVLNLRGIRGFQIILSNCITKGQVFLINQFAEEVGYAGFSSYNVMTSYINELLYLSIKWMDRAYHRKDNFSFEAKCRGHVLPCLDQHIAGSEKPIGQQGIPNYVEQFYHQMLDLSDQCKWRGRLIRVYCLVQTPSVEMNVTHL